MIKSGLFIIFMWNSFISISQNNTSSSFDLNDIKKDLLSSSQAPPLKSADSLKKELEKVIYKKDIKKEIIIRRNIGSLYFEEGNIAEALEYLISAKQICENSNYKYEKAKTYLKLADAYFFIGEYAIEYKLILEAVEIFQSKKDSFNLANGYNNLAEVERRVHETSKSLSHLNTAMNYAKATNNKIAEAKINTNYGTLYLTKNQDGLAREYLNKALVISRKQQDKSEECKVLLRIGRTWANDLDSITYYLDLAYKTSLKYKKYLWTGRCLYYLCQVQIEKGQRKKAFQNMHIAIEFYNIIDDVIMKGAMYRYISQVFIKENNIDSAFYYDKLADKAKDTIITRKNLTEIINLKWSYAIKEKKAEIAMLKTNKQILELKQKSEQKAKLWFWAALFVLLSLCVILFYFFKTKTSLLTKEKQLSQFKKDKYNFEIEQKNKELVTYTMQLYSKSKTILEVKNNINELKNEYANKNNPKFVKDIQQLNFMLDSNIRLDGEWEKLKIQFQEIHKGFYDRLKKKHETLSQYDLKLCTFIYLGFDTKQISQILNIDPNSLRTQRYRMRKKMELASNKNLINYITNLVDTDKV